MVRGFFCTCGPEANPRVVPDLGVPSLGPPKFQLYNNTVGGFESQGGEDWTRQVDPLMTGDFRVPCIPREGVEEREREREIERDLFYFLKVHLGDSNRQPQSSRENLE